MENIPYPYKTAEQLLSELRKRKEAYLKVANSPEMVRIAYEKTLQEYEFALTDMARSLSVEYNRVLKLNQKVALQTEDIRLLRHTNKELHSRLDTIEEDAEFKELIKKCDEEAALIAKGK